MASQRSKISIRVNGSEDDCIEYDNPDPPGVSASLGSATHTTSKVIESQADVGFSIHYEIQNRQNCIRGNNCPALGLHIDGNNVTWSYFEPDDLVNQTIVSEIDNFWARCSTPGKVVQTYFKFAPVKTVEKSNRQLSEDQRIAKHLGIIEVVVCRVKFEGDEPRVVEEYKRLESAEVSERARKGKSLSHSTSFIGGIEEDEETTDGNYRLRDGNKLIARFFFRYKPRTFLQVEGIIPRDHSPEPSPPPPPQTVANLPLADILRLAQERLDELEPKVKREPGTGVKREADGETDSRPRKVYKVDADGTIDLCDD